MVEQPKLSTSWTIMVCIDISCIHKYVAHVCMLNIYIYIIIYTVQYSSRNWWLVFPTFGIPPLQYAALHHQKQQPVGSQPCGLGTAGSLRAVRKISSQTQMFIVRSSTKLPSLVASGIALAPLGHAPNLPWQQWQPAGNPQKAATQKWPGAKTVCWAFLEAWRPFNDLYGDFADSLALHLGSMPHLGQLLIHVMQTACHVALVALLISPRPIKGWGKPSRQILSRHHSTYLAYLYQWGIWAIPLLGPGRAKRPMTYLTWTATLSC